MKPGVYIETTIPSLLTAWPNRDVSIAGQQQTKRDWWNERRKKYELYVSVFVLDEIRQGDGTAAAARLAEAKEYISLLPNASPFAAERAPKLLEVVVKTIGTLMIGSTDGCFYHHAAPCMNRLHFRPARVEAS